MEILPVKPFPAKYLLNFPLAVIYYEEFEEKELAKQNINIFLKSYKFNGVQKKGVRNLFDLYAGALIRW